MQVILSAGDLGGEAVEWPTDSNGNALPEAVFTDSEGRLLKYAFADWTNLAQGVFAGYSA